MIDLKIPIWESASCINAWNYLSKSLLLWEYSQKQKILFLLHENKKISAYTNIFDYIWLEYIPVNDYASVIDMKYSKEWFYIADSTFLSTTLETGYNFEKNYVFFIHSEEEFAMNTMIHKLTDFWFSFSEYRKPGSYKKMWDLLQIYPSFTENFYYRISFFWDEVEKIERVYSNRTSDIDILAIGKIEKFQSTIKESLNETVTTFLKAVDMRVVGDGFDFYRYKDELTQTFEKITFFDAIQNKKNKNHDLHIHELFLDDIASLNHQLQDLSYTSRYILTKNKTTLDNFLNYNNITWVKVRECRVKNIGSFYSESITWEKTLIIADDNLDRVFVKKRVKRSFSKDLDLLIHIKLWDNITHIDHGVWIFLWIVKKELNISGKIIVKEYLELEYLWSDKLFVPITEVKRVSKYIGKEQPKLTGLSTKEWSKKLKKVWEEVEDIAEELLEVFAKRNLKEWFQFVKDTEKIVEFQSDFPYSYTDDQEQAIEEIFSDMNSLQPMDRLLNGDVGFWKTEVCFNAIYNAFCNKKQSILLTPLVVLAYEHYEKAKERFESFGMRVWVLTRFEKANAVTRILEKLKKWEIDVVVWTHKLLSKDVLFKDLWLVVIDEEHKFWVKDKERIKELKWQVDILSLSATPIPRSLNMALNWLKQVSILRTPPFGRKPIETYVSRFSDEIIVDACRTEFERDWQVFFIHNRVSNIESFGNYLQTLFPHKSIIITHGQLPGDELEKRIIAFRKREFDILLSTTVIENGVDFPNVNTIFINEAYKFGISQIHQLRGRVGRSERQWYCYLIYRNENINPDAEKRLKTIVDYSHLWAGFELAMRDLEIRGWGEILWKKQSGQVAEVGISIFIEMLESKITELKRLAEYKANKDLKNYNLAKQNLSSLPPQERGIEGESSQYKINTSIDLNISAYIPDSFFGSSMDKMNFYRELETVENTEDLQTIIAEFQQINAQLPPETENLFALLKLKFIASSYNISVIKKTWLNYQIEFLSSEWKELETIKKFLDLDVEVNFTVGDMKRLRTPVKKYMWDLGFMNYLKDMFKSKVGKKKFKLKK